MDELEWYWYWENINVEIAIDPKVYTFLTQQKQLDKENEKGGQLFMDHQNPDGLKIIAATPSHPSDRAGKSWLELNEDRCRREILRYNKLGYVLIGYWHTHPQEYPELSGQDKNSFCRFSKINRGLLPNPVAIIVGRAQDPDGVRIWSFQDMVPIQADRRYREDR